MTLSRRKGSSSHELKEMPMPWTERRTSLPCSGCDSPISERVRILRRDQNMSIRALAEKCGISMNTLSLIENNRTSPSVHTLALLAAGLGVPLIALFQEGERPQQLVYQQAGQRQRLAFAHGTLEQLGEGLPPMGAEPILVTLTEDQTDPVRHSGREFIYCLHGDMTCIVSGQSFQLSVGDSLLFDAGLEHRWVNSQDQPAKLLVLFCPMEARDKPAEHHLDH
jgi:transcriptional regulator with XRE-family HTH domain